MMRWILGILLVLGGGIFGGIAGFEIGDPDGIVLTPTKPDGGFQIGIGVEPEFLNDASGGMWIFHADGYRFLIRTIADDAILDIDSDPRP